MNKKVALLMSAALLALTGCGGSGETYPYPTPDPHKEYLAYVHKYTNANDAELIKFGDDVCRALDNGLTTDDLFDVYVTHDGMDVTLAGRLVGASVGYLCPKHLNQIPGANQPT
jgi:hypothetical protein